MNKSIMYGCVLGVSSLMLSNVSFADVYDPVTATWNGTTNVVGGAWNGTTNVVGGAWNGTTNVVGGAWNGTTTVVGGAWNGTANLVDGVLAPVGRVPVLWGATPRNNRSMYVVTDVNNGSTREVVGLRNYQAPLVDVVSCGNTVFPGICSGQKYTITDSSTGRQYRVVRVKQGTMDVMRGNRTIRYQYVVPIVKPI